MSLFLLLAKRLAYALLLIAAVQAMNFTLIRAAPGDPAEVIAGEMGGADEAVMAQIRATYGLDQPVPLQYARYIVHSLTGDLGTSYLYSRPVVDLILERLGPTVLLVATALLLAMVIGTLLGVAASRRPDSAASGVITVLSLVGYAMPVFWTGILLVLLFGKVLPILPIAGMRDVRIYGDGWVVMLDVLHHLVLPALTLSLVYLAQYSRLARASMLEVLGTDYIRTARAKGLPESSVVYKHALRNALMPVVTVAGLQFGNLISGAVLVETVFSWPGLGTLALDAILGRDYPTVLGVLTCSAALVIVANLLTDLAYRWLDPRLRGRR
ncbi:ABC transporter permease [Pseudothauera nasutitermitis]|uniref:ABC transporter permease n=1 Tax=Pseudothauera nasutitermitis TaxID=2565930 RepID=A0A4S4B628_9RHOO|nr:ABC transporter permease [Pseudothauera nasutitermitis]THF67276.1 ABC transporter permease [Pseudothauera nasutitermitis]